MILREAIRQVRGFRYMIEQLDICSAVGRRVLYDLPWLDSKSRLEAEFERIQKIMVLFEQPENESRLERLTGKISGGRSGGWRWSKCWMILNCSN